MIFRVKNEQKSRLVHEDIYLVKKEPIRGKKVVESSRKANMHVVAEFALQVILPMFDFSYKMRHTYIYIYSQI